jgi:uncharacterized protein YndB with AHSA1/START domain
MTSNAPSGQRVLGVLGSADGKGVVRARDRFDTDIDDLWEAITDRSRLARWLGEVEGDFRLGGEFRAQFFASGWSGTGIVEACEPPRRLLVLTRMEPEEPYEHAIEANLTADGEGTILVWEERGMSLDLLAEYGAGIQVRVEDLAASLAGHGRVDAQSRWEEELPAYKELAGRSLPEA